MAFKYKSLPVVSAIQVSKPTITVLGKTGTDIVLPGHSLGFGANPAARSHVLGKNYGAQSEFRADSKLPNLELDSLLLRNEEFIDELRTKRRVLQRKNSYFELELSFLQKLSGVLDNLNKFLSALSYKAHYSYQTTKLEELLLTRRHEQLKEFLLEKEKDLDKTKSKKPKLTDKQKLDRLRAFLKPLVAAASGLSNIPSVTGSFTVRGAAFAKQMMAKYGLTDIQAAAMFGTMSWESSLIPYNVENSSQYNAQEPLPPPYGATYVGYGWAQWTNISNTPGDRLNLFITKYLGGGPGKRGRAATDQDNFNYLTWELDNRAPYKGKVIADLKKQTTIEGAVNSFLSLYEGVPGNRFVERVQRSKGILEEMRKAVGGIVIPELFGKDYMLKYDTQNLDNVVSSFVVDKPTIIDTNEMNEPLVIIPLERPIGKTILNILFKPIFDKIEAALAPIIKQQKPKKKEEKQSIKAPIASKPRNESFFPPTLRSPQEDTKQESIKKPSVIDDKDFDIQNQFIDLLDIPSKKNILPGLDITPKETPAKDSLSPTISPLTPQKTPDAAVFSPQKESTDDVIDSINKLSTKTNIFSESSTNVVIFTRDVYV